MDSFIFIRDELRTQIEYDFNIMDNLDRVFVIVGINEFIANFQ